MADTVLQIFSNAPIDGFVKTRLIPELGVKAATDVYITLLSSVVELAASSNYSVQLWCAPDLQHDFFQQVAKKYKFALRKQRGANLGDKMKYALEQGLHEANRVVLIGADCPVFTLNYLMEAFQLLTDSKVVLGPAEDGGFVLIGCTKVRDNMFSQVDWGEATVLSQTLKALTGAKLTYSLLPMLWDVDTLSDLKRWQAS